MNIVDFIEIHSVSRGLRHEKHAPFHGRRVTVEVTNGTRALLGGHVSIDHDVRVVHCFFDTRNLMFRKNVITLVITNAKPCDALVVFALKRSRDENALDVANSILLAKGKNDLFSPDTETLFDASHESHEFRRRFGIVVIESRACERVV